MSLYTYEVIKENEHLPAFFNIVSAPTITIPAHWHKYLEILYIISGQMTAVIQAETYELSKGDTLIINSEDIHMTQTHGEETTYILLQISSAQLRSFFPDFHLLRFDTHIQRPNPGNMTPEPGYYLMEMCAVFSEKEDGYPLLFSARLHELLYYLYRHHSRWLPPDRQALGQRNLSHITRILDWIQAHYQEPLTLNEAAAYLGFSREYFCRLFKKYTGQTFLEYINDIRAMRFYEDLKHSDDSITTLMGKHGITNYKVFLHTFRKLYGNTPQKIRQQSLSQSEPR